MTAPTPISSLVHSSTLVTAGIYLLIRINYIFFFENLFYFLKIIGVITIFLGRIIACIEIDYKKVIAYSTLRQLGLITFILGFGEIYLRFFQLIRHAIFKSLLFICVGVVISSGFGNQDRRIIGKNVINNYFLIVLIGFCCLNLRGFPLLMGFFSKDLILEILFSERTNFLILIIFLISCVFSVSYRVKIYFNSFYIINFGRRIRSFFYLKKELAFLFLLFFFMSFIGIISEEFLTIDYLYRFEQSIKILDFSLIIIGIVFHIYLTNIIKKSKL
ncbi:proton-conducting transporter transmembrane domain-containing protein [Mycolicibacterium neoaurum]|uniref:proton-conducting transporter transmembrane domain-containing protein n=1 Tax=Mycolicibacterium neoaurum TaxID=1795 RepID=UPI003559358E